MAGTTLSSAAEYFQLMTEQFAKLDHAAIDRYVELVYEAWRDGRRVFLFGNGGSAYTASHHVTDYVKTASDDGRPRLAAMSLVDNTGLVTALGNDVSYDDIFRYQLEAYARPGDLAVAISCSGNSPNVVKACEWAREHELTVVCISGCDGGKMCRFAHLHINIPSDNFGVVEDIQMAIGHIAAQGLYNRVKTG